MALKVKFGLVSHMEGFRATNCHLTSKSPQHPKPMSPSQGPPSQPDPFPTNLPSSFLRLPTPKFLPPPHLPSDSLPTFFLDLPPDLPEILLDDLPDSLPIQGVGEGGVKEECSRGGVGERGVDRGVVWKESGREGQEPFE